MPRFKTVPRWVFVAACLMVAAISVITTAGFYVNKQNNEQQQDRCEFAVKARDDQRRVWLFLINRVSVKAPTPEQEAFIRFFNENLPPLACDSDGNLIEVHED